MADHEAGSGLKLYMHMGSQPARSLVIFCRANEIEAQEIKVDLVAQETRKPEFKKINPMGLIPCIDDGGFLLFESHAILRYLAATRSVADHWYPKDAKKRALIDAALDWHHLNLHAYACQLFQNRTLAKIPRNKGFFSERDNDGLALAAEQRLPRVFDELEIMLQNSKFLQNADEVSIADLSMACEMMQLQAICCAKDRESLLGSRERLKQWVADVEEALSPHFGDVHEEIFAFGKHLEELRANGADF